MALIKVGSDYRVLLVYDYENRDFPEWEIRVDPETLVQRSFDNAAAVITTGTYVGYVSVDCYGGREPRPIIMAEWEDVAQIVLPNPSSQLCVVPPTGEGVVSENLLVAPGPVVVRVAARGRREMWDREIGPTAYDTWEPTEVLAIDVWPKRPGDDDEEPFTSNDERAAALAPWLEHYNTERRHQALDGQPPISRLTPTS